MTLSELELRLTNLEKAFLQAQQNNVDTVAKADTTVSLNEGLTSVSEKTETNTTNISNNFDNIGYCMEAITEVYELVTPSDDTTTD